MTNFKLCCKYMVIMILKSNNFVDSCLYLMRSVCKALIMYVYVSYTGKIGFTLIIYICMFMCIKCMRICAVP